MSNLFLVDDPQVAVLLNYGSAALAWLLITLVVVRLTRRIG
jgi:Trk-type K+ transport system membrane component